MFTGPENGSVSLGPSFCEALARCSFGLVVVVIVTMVKAPSTGLLGVSMRSVPGALEIPEALQTFRLEVGYTALDPFRFIGGILLTVVFSWRVFLDKNSSYFCGRDWLTILLSLLLICHRMVALDRTDSMDNMIVVRDVCEPSSE